MPGAAADTDREVRGAAARGKRCRIVVAADDRRILEVGQSRPVGHRHARAERKTVKPAGEDEPALFDAQVHPLKNGIVGKRHVARDHEHRAALPIVRRAAHRGVDHRAARVRRGKAARDLHLAADDDRAARRHLAVRLAERLQRRGGACALVRIDAARIADVENIGAARRKAAVFGRGADTEKAGDDQKQNADIHARVFHNFPPFSYVLNKNSY